MQYLVIDTSGTKNFLTLVVKGAEKTVHLPAKELTKVLHFALISLEIPPLDFIAICNGPGFFTGIRIGVSVAKTLSYSKNIPLIPFHSLELLDSSPHQAKVLDARGGKVYVAYGENPPFLSPMAELPERLPSDIQELITLDSHGLISPHYPLSEKKVSPRKQEKIWRRQLECGETETYSSLQIEYLH